MTVGGKIAYSNEKNLVAGNSGSLPGEAFASAGSGRLAVALPPNISPFMNDGSGRYNIASATAIGAQGNVINGANPFTFNNARLLMDLNRSNNEVNRIQGNFYVQIKPASWLTIKSLYGIDNNLIDNDAFWNPYHGDGTSIGIGPGGGATSSFSKDKTWVWTNTAQADFKVGQDHNFSVLVGSEQQRQTFLGYGAGSKLGLPLRITAIKGGGSSDLARSTVAQVYAQIIADLDYAEANLPLTNSNAVTRTTRAQRNAAIALKTRVYLSMQDYPKAITEANKMVPAAAPFVATSGTAHALQADIRNVFVAPYTTLESILSVPFTTIAGDGPGTQNGLQAYFFFSTTGLQSIFSVNPTGIWANAGWKATDRRKIGLSYTNAVPGAANFGRIYITKYPTAAPADNTPIIRWSEVLLNLAEARVRTTNTVDAQAVALLNAVRNRSDATTIFTVASFANATALTDAILTERRIEFIAEGFRNNDLMRLLQTIPAKGVAPVMPPTGEQYIWPVSVNEKQLNKLWVD